MKRSWWPWLCALASGALLTLCFPPANLGGLVWLSLVPLICALWFSEPWAQRERWRFFALGYATGLVYFVGCFYWLYTVTIPGWIALCLFLALYPAVWAVVVGHLKPWQSPFEARPIWMKSWHNLLIAAQAAVLWAGLEWLRGIIFFGGFGWNGLGVALHENIALIQICDITGVGGLSFLVVMVNMIIVITVRRLQIEIGRQKLRPHYDFSLTVALIVLVFSYGVRKLYAPLRPSDPLSVAIVQANIPLSEKRDPAHEEEILNIHTRLTETALAVKPDLIIWPEAATPRPLFTDQANWDAVRSLAERHSGDFLLGTVDLDNAGDFNSVVLLTENGRTAQKYNKIHLVAFGEYLPFREWFSYPLWVTSQIPDDFDFGEQATVLEMARKPLKIAPLVCFEDTLGAIARQFVLNDAQLFVNVTNDGWFLRSAQSEQHVQQALFRCVEAKIPMARAANTGVSCIIDSFGRVRQKLQDENKNTFMEGVLMAEIEVPREPVNTFYTLHGEIFSQGCLGAGVLAGGILFLRRRRVVAEEPKTLS